MRHLFSALLLAVIGLTNSSRATMVPVEQIYDFGAVAIEFSIVHDFKFVNVGNTTVRIDSAHADCDCTTTFLIDPVAGPNDTAVVRVVFETTNFYGRISKLMSVFTNEKGNSPVQVYYLATVGQWIYGIKPDPISLFYLPSHKSRTFSITNPASPLIEISSIQTIDSLLTVRVVKNSAERGGRLELEVIPREKLNAGTYNSNFRVTLKVKGASEPVLLTVPVKVVRY